MHMTKLKLVFLTAAAFTVGGPLSGQTPAAGLEFLPGGGIFIPPLGHYREARTGVRGELGTTRLKVDIGTSLDILEYRPDAGGDSRLRLGAEFFVYALTTSYSGNRLQVDATDGFFGGHILWRKDLREDRGDIRLRIIHLSSHMVDGHYDPNTGTWLDGRDPIPFTRRLRLPHPRMHRRRFVLRPLCDIDPDVVHPVLGKAVRALLAELDGEGQQVVEHR